MIRAWLRRVACGGLMIMTTSPVPTDTQMPSGYEVRRTDATQAALLDGDPTAWRDAAVITWGPEPYTTRLRALWSVEALWLRFDAVDAAPWSTMTERDDPIWNEEVVEIFLDLDGSGTNYAELEISPANVVCDVRMVQGLPDKQMDLSWNLEGVETRVDHGDVDGGRGWTARARVPWAGFASLPSAAGVALPPRSGNTWRFNAFRIKRPYGPAEPDRDVIFAAWSDPGAAGFHVPAAFRPFRLVEP